MTGGAARAFQAATQGGEQRNPAAATSTMGAMGAMDRSQTPPRPAAEPKMTAPAQPAPRSAERPIAEPRLSGLDASAKQGDGQLDEDLLDIPAFLRRQAN
jgi:cell division protein FtsZ